MTNRLLVLMVLVLLPLCCSSKPLENDVPGTDRETNGEVTTLSSHDVDDAERSTESTTELWNSEMLRDVGVEHWTGQSPESPVGEISSDLPTTWEPMVELTTEASAVAEQPSPLSLSMEPQSAASDRVETESTTLLVEEVTEPNEISPEITTMTDEMLVQDDQFTTEVMADDLVNMSEMNSSASAESDKADEGSSFLTEAEFTTQLPDYLFTDEVESTTQMELVTEDSTESATATETATDAPVPSSEMPHPVHHVKRPLNKKKRSYEGYRVYRVILPTEESVQRILALEGEPGIDFWADPHLLLRPRGLFVTSAADIMASPKAIPLVEEVFRRSRLPFVVMVDNVQKLISQENPSLAMTRKDLLTLHGHSLTWQRYHRLGDIYSYVDHLKETHPDLVNVIRMGKSSQGRPIKVIHLSSGRDEQKAKKAIFIDAGVHGNEWITTATLTWMVKQLVENAGQYDCILNQFDWYFVPVVNPDGYEYSHAVDRMWRKSRTDYSNLLSKISGSVALRKLRFDDNDHEEECRGADINRNFEFQWRKGGSSINVCSGSFAGVHPFSEPESQALANFILKRKKDIAMYISLHSYSQMWLLPWGYTEKRPEDFSQLFSLAKIGARSLQRIHNTTYLIGTIPDLLYVASGSTQDWAKGVAGIKYSYTIELRDAGERGMILPAKHIVPTGEETWAGVYAAARELATRITPPSVDPSSSCPYF